MFRYLVAYLAFFLRMEKHVQWMGMELGRTRHLASTYFVDIHCLHNKTTWLAQARENSNDNKSVKLSHVRRKVAE